MRNNQLYEINITIVIIIKRSVSIWKLSFLLNKSGSGTPSSTLLNKTILILIK